MMPKSKLKTKFTPLNDLLAPRMMVTTSYTGQKAVSSLMKHDEYSYRKQFHTQFPSIDQTISKRYITINNKSGDISKIEE